MGAEITGRIKESRTVVWDIEVAPIDEHDDFDVEYVIKVNGRPIKRMNGFAARRQGLISNNR